LKGGATRSRRGAVVSSSSGRDAARPTKLDPFKAYVLERMKEGVLDAVRVRRGDRPQDPEGGGEGGNGGFFTNIRTSLAEAISAGQGAEPAVS